MSDDADVEDREEVFIPRPIDQEMKESYINYAMSAIIGRARPDGRDGLKPVHRRVLFGMYEGGHTHDKSYSKSARSVGEVMGKYHPHGDQSIYDTMVRMAQDFSLRYPLIDGQGNFGSIDGDPPAAMRYTESRLDRITQHMMADIDKDTVDFQPNFDDSEQEPEVLPSCLPNLLLNLLLLVLGMFLHGAAAIILVVPVVMPLVNAVGTSASGMPAATAVSRLTSTSAMKACSRTFMIRNSRTATAAAAISSSVAVPWAGAIASIGSPGGAGLGRCRAARCGVGHPEGASKV